MQKNTFYDLFAKYLAGKANQDDIAELQNWLDASEENKTFFHSVTNFWDDELNYFKKDSERVAQELAQRIKTSEEKPDHSFVEVNKTSQLRAKRVTSFSYKIAAAIGALLIAGAALYFSGYLNQLLNPVENTISVKLIERTTKPGEKLNVKLPDGSLVKLNANSTLIFPEQFSDQERNVTLTGEAFFDVVRNPERPFHIKSGNISTTVLGTTFNVRAFPEEKNISVAVVSGRVAVKPLNMNTETPETLLLNPNEMAVYSEDNNQTVKSGFDYMEIVAWKDGIIYFKDATIDEMFKTLGQWYGVSFNVTKALNKKKGFTVSHKDKSLENILEGLSFSYGFEFEIDDKIVHIK
ncbi:FecR domain-containing protein [Fulvivirgaceae bacterium BMA10]|uniref:FecR domain-containing protein n=1 Tax=Splendidivirga corallicola TaxID=3051826 RepID=A0ABT8KY71_9BACT|nr:FecR domain-containing protein [Fulvivirgaceae bacterium BMA10]